MAGGIALLLALAASSGMSIATPARSGPITLAVIEISPGGTFLNALQFPPTEGDPEGQRGALFEHPGTLVEQVLAGPMLPPRISIRSVRGEMAGMYRVPVRRLAFLERTEGGYWLIQWDRRIEQGRACLEPDAIAHYAIVAPGRTPDENGEICFNL